MSLHFATGTESYLLKSSPFANDQTGILQKISLISGKQVVVEGQQFGEWFGYSLSVEPGVNPKYAYVGAPNHRLCSTKVCENLQNKIACFNTEY